jgi:hypothetical protein
MLLQYKCMRDGDLYLCPSSHKKCIDVCRARWRTFLAALCISIMQKAFAYGLLHSPLESALPALGEM